MWPDLEPPPEYENPDPRWSDPKCPDMRLIWKLAREVGYSVGVHGSLKRDFDLIAAPWTDEAIGSADLVDHLCRGLNAEMISGPEYKPLGRVAVNIQIDGWYKPIDLSIMPMVKKESVFDYATRQIAKWPNWKKKLAGFKTITPHGGSL